MIAFIILAVLGAGVAGVGTVRLFQMLDTRVAKVKGNVWPRSAKPFGYWSFVGQVALLSVAGASLAAVCFFILIFHDFGV